MKLRFITKRALYVQLTALCLLLSLAGSATAETYDASVALTGGEFTFTASEVLLDNVTLNNGVVRATGSATGWRATDARGSGEGWYVTASVTEITSVNERVQLSETTPPLMISLENIEDVSGGASPIPTTTLSEMTPLPLSGSPGLVILSASKDSGMGTFTMDADFAISLPTEMQSETYTATINITTVLAAP